MSSVKISNGNQKMGAIPSVSLPSVITCRSCDCQKKCYARKLERLRPTVAAAYRHNLDLLQSDPDTYWREVEASIMMSRFFRFHVSGDIPDSFYFQNMVNIATRNPHCQVLCFTKKYEVVNDYVETHGTIMAKAVDGQKVKALIPERAASTALPDNLHVIFSGWPGLQMNNPFSLPEAHVRFRDGSTTAPDNAQECHGNCSECARTDGGCWSLKSGESVVFNEH